jgi:glycosyltransferase involved in cell wall biosynthesis
LKISVIGTRGFPNIQGGVEKHCEVLYSYIIKYFPEIIITVYRRKPYVKVAASHANDKSIQFYDIWTVKNKYFEAVLHSLISSIVCVIRRPDLVHIHNIGPSLVLPILKLFKIRSVVTFHSDNYNHDKWGFFSKKALKLGEWFVGRMADRIILVSEWQKSIFKDKNNVSVIPNGVTFNNNTEAIDYLNHIGVMPGEYVLAVSRFVPEKGLHLLVQAFKELRSECKLVIAGDADHETVYSRNLKKSIYENERIVNTGYITGEPLKQVFSHAKLFVLPSFHEGLPIALLEAMSFGLSVLVSDIPANREVDLPGYRFFKSGDVEELKIKMEYLLQKDITENERIALRTQIIEKYNWDKIALQTLGVYKKVLTL